MSTSVSQCDLLYLKFNISYTDLRSIFVSMKDRRVMWISLKM